LFRLIHKTDILRSTAQHTAVIRYGVLLTMLVLLTACATNNDEVNTLIAQNITLSTEVASARGTATAAADQIRITSDFFATQAQGASDRQLFIVRTLDALGVDTSGVSLITPQLLPPTPVGGAEAAVQSNVAGGGITVVAPTPLEFGTTTMPTLDTASTPFPPTIDPTQPNLGNASVSSSVGSDDCATGSSSVFDVTTPEIYAVGTANNFPAGYSLTFTWTRNGEALLTDTFTWDSPVNGACIWYFVTPADFEFLPGSYTVSFDNNGVQVASLVTFELTDPSGASGSTTSTTTGTLEVAPPP
jgi:hypothetical protein